MGTFGKMAPKTRSDMDDEMKLRLPAADKTAFEEAANQLRISTSAFMRMAGWEKIRHAGLQVGKDREKAAERRQRVAAQIGMLRGWIREEPALQKPGEQAIAVLEGLIQPDAKRPKGGGR